MNRKKVDPETMESSSSEEADEVEEEEEGDAENGEEESASESSGDDDEFDSSDERVNMVPIETPSETFKSFAQEESSDESVSDEEEETGKPALKPAEAEKIRNIKSFASDVESEYETESGSESEGLTQKTVVQESSIEADALPLTQKKAKKNVVSVDQGIVESDLSAKKGKTKGLKQHQDSKPSKIKEEANPLVMKGQGGAPKQTLKDSEQSQSVKDEKKGGLSAMKRKLASTWPDGETASVDSVPASKKRKDVATAEVGRANGDRGKVAHALSDVGKEIAKKTLSDPSSKLNGSKDVSNRVSAVEHDPRQQKKAHADAGNGPSSPQKQKKLPHVWSTDEEITMASEVLNRVRMGLDIPSKRGDDFWLILSEVLHEKWGVEFSRDQLSEKLRRMKQRYQSAAQKIKETRDSKKPYKHKSDKEQNLFDIWSQIWGRAEVIPLEDHQAASDSKKEPSKALAVTASFAKEAKTPANAPKSKPASKAKASNESAMAAAENDVGRDAVPPLEGVTPMPVEPDKPEAAKEDSPVADESAALSKDMHKLLESKIHETLDELQKWSKNNMEAWMSKALALVENSVKALGDQARRLNVAGIAGGGVPMGFCDSMELRFTHGEQAFQQQWYELHLQELNIYCQRLELMQKECKLRQEQLKLQLQVERGK